MEKRIKNYITYLEDEFRKNLSEKERSCLMQDLLIQIGFFQHERLIHLIVTVTFAILTVVSVLCNFFAPNLSLFALILLLLALLIPYIRHYYILENNVQKLYCFYDQLKNLHTIKTV